MPLQYSILTYGCDMGDKDGNGWAEHKRAVYQRFDTIDKTNETQTATLKTIGESIGRLNPELMGKKLCSRWVSVLMGYPTKWTDLRHLETE